MDWLIAILLLVVGGLIGYFVAKFVNKGNLSTTDERNKEQSFKDIMTQHAANHVQESKEIVNRLMTQAEALIQQIDAYEQLTNKLNTKEDAASVSYFGEHASAYLRHNSNKQNIEKASTEFQPLDFASQSSGLFSGDEGKKRENIK